MRWSLNPYKSIAGYVWGGGRDDVWLERGLSGTGTTTLEGALQLIFGRTFEGWSGLGKTITNCIRNTPILLVSTGVQKCVHTVVSMNMATLTL